MKRNLFPGKNCIYIDQLYSPLGQCLLFEFLKEKDRGVSIQQIITNKEQHVFESDPKTNNPREKQDSSKTSLDSGGWTSIDFSMDHLHQSPILGFLENNDPIFSWKSRLFKDRKAFWEEGTIEKAIKSDEGGAESDSGELGFNFFKTLKEKRQNFQDIRKTYAKVFRQGWGRTAHVTSVKVKDLKAILRVIRSCRVLVFDLRVSSLKLVERFLVALRYLKKDGVKRKVVLVSDIMTWAGSVSESAQPKSGPEIRASVAKMLKQMEQRTAVYQLQRSHSELQNRNVRSESLKTRIHKMSSRLSEREKPELKIDFLGGSPDESAKTDDFFKGQAKKDWRKSAVEDLARVLGQSQDALERELSRPNELGRRKGRFLRGLRERKSENDLEQMQETEKDRIRARVYDSMKRRVFGAEDMEQIFGLDYEQKRRKSERRLGWQFWREFGGERDKKRQTRRKTTRAPQKRTSRRRTPKSTTPNRTTPTRTPS